MNRKLEREIRKDRKFAMWMLQSFIDTQPTAEVENLYMVFKSGVDVKRLPEVPQDQPKKSLLQRIRGKLKHD